MRRGQGRLLALVRDWRAAWVAEGGFYRRNSLERDGTRNGAAHG